MKSSILVVESDMKYRTALNDRLRQFDVEIVNALSYKDALQVINKRAFDAAVVEFCMEEDTADMVCWALNRGDRATTALIVTSPAQGAEMERRIRTFSPAVYLVKPYDVNDVYATVSRVFNRLRDNTAPGVRRTAAPDDTQPMPRAAR